MKKVVTISILLILFFSCNNRFSGYDDLGDDIYMKLLAFEESNNKFEAAAYIKTEIYVNDYIDLLYHNFPENILAKENPFNFLIKHLNEGDSAVFYVGKSVFKEKMNSFPFPEIKSEYLTITIKVHRFYSKKEYKEELVEMDNEMLEQVILKKYLAERGISSKDKKNGIYVKQIAEGKGKAIGTGDIVVINYKAHFTNHIEFDNTYLDMAFTFTLGTPDQVIKGLELAIKGMKQGEEAEIVIPSQFAFGEGGSSTGVVPPYTTVVYKLKIVKIEGN